MLLPRCLSAATLNPAPLPFFAKPDQPPQTPNLSEVSDVLTEDPIKRRRIDQRKAEIDEPFCVVCGRYGEYICNETEDDVCSLECKSVVLFRKGLLQVQDEESLVAQEFHPVQNECIVVSDGNPRLPEWEANVKTRLNGKQIEDLRKSLEIRVQGDQVPAPILDFSSCGFHEKLQQNLMANYESPTPVQMQAIPAALKGRDLLVCAGTGSGKTLSFILPIIYKCCRVRMGHFSEGKKPLAIIMAPTRELAGQVEEQAKMLGKGLPFKTALVVGGDAMPQQVYRIKKGIELIIGTPGRLIDLLFKHDLDLGDVCMLVLDEVDCMLQHGFRDQVMQIVQALSQPQIMLFSATIPKEIEKFSSTILNKPIAIFTGCPNQPNKAIQQNVMWLDSKAKKKKLFEILQSPNHFRPPAVVFVNSRLGADLLADAIKTVTNIHAVSLHGEKPMNERREIMQSFLLGEVPIVVATGVLGRGLDLLRVTQVIIYDMPNSLQEYIHQIGRASRLGITGSAMVFINNDSKALFREFIQLLRNAGAAVPQQLANSPYAHSSYAVAYNPRKRKV